MNPKLEDWATLISDAISTSNGTFVDINGKPINQNKPWRGSSIGELDTLVSNFNGDGEDYTIVISKYRKVTTAQQHAGLSGQEVQQVTGIDMDAHPVPQTEFPFDKGV